MKDAFHENEKLKKGRVKMTKDNKKVDIQSPQKLTLTNLKKYDEEKDELETVILANGKFSIKINKFFRLTQIQKLIIDIQEATATLRKEDVDIDDMVTTMLTYQMLLLKYFSDLPIKHLDMSKKKDIEKMVSVAKQLLDSNIFIEIINSFPEEGLKMVQEAIEQSSVLSKQMGEMLTSISLKNMNNNNITDLNDTTISTY